MYKEYPLSLLQEPWWLIQQLDPRGTAQAAANAIRIRSAVDPEHLRAAWDTFTKRHELLRTTFHGVDVAVQRTHDGWSFEPEFSFHDVPGVSEEELVRLVKADYSRPFDLARRAIRASLFRRSANDHVLLVAHQHITFDLTAGDILHDELPRLYVGQRDGRAVDLPPCGRSFEQFVEQERRTLSGSRGEALRTFWTEYLGGVKGVLALPTDRQRHEARRYVGDSLTFHVSRELTSRLVALAEQRRTSLFRLLLAAYSVFLHRHSGDDDLVIGTPADCRTPEFSDTVGDFVNILPIRVSCRSDDTFDGVLSKVAGSVSQASKHRELPFVKILDLANVPRNPRITPLYQTLFRLNRTMRVPAVAAEVVAGAPWRADLQGLAAEGFPLAIFLGNVDFEMAGVDVDGELYFAASYSPELYDRETIERMCARFPVLLEGIVADPGQRIDRLPLYPPEERRTEGGDLERQVDYWKGELVGAPALELPTDRPRPPVQTFSGANVDFEVPAPVRAKLAELAAREQATSFMTMLAAFEVLLARHAGQTDFVVGTLSSSANPLALRANVSPTGTFRELLRRVKEQVLAAEAHQEAPVEKVVEAVKPAPDTSRSRLFQVMFALAQSERKATPADVHFAKLDLALSCLDRESGLSGSLRYNADLFERVSADQIVSRFGVLLEGIAQAPDLRIDHLPLLPDTERHKLLVEWNDTRVEYAAEAGFIHEVFEKQVERTPSAIALEFEDERLTYAELDARANRLAHWLREKGIGPERTVGVLMERSVHMVTALYATLKAGGAYVPLDPDLPRERLASMVAQSGVSLILAQPHTRDRAPTAAVDVVALGPELESQPATPPQTRVHGGHPAYVIYTSGSTGNPKGVVNTHEGIRNRILWMQGAFSLTEDDCVLQKTPFSFDVSVWEFFWPLMYGARLVIARPGEHRDARALVRLIESRQVTTLHFVPSMLGVFLDEADAGSCKSIRRVICSGEALTPELCRRHRERIGAELDNLYGPTEAAVDVTWWNCSSRKPSSTVPIGQPIANTSVFVLDSEMNLAPIGGVGELFLGGIQLARGYAARPDLTAERFVPSPFGDGGRLYRTGDLARFRHDGAVEYLGRIDHQVKVRGFRIELGEIEAVLATHPGVREVVVVAREDVPGDKRLVAYIVIAGEVDVEALRSHLEQRVPEYMVPSAFVMLDALPLSANGKIDRKSLPAPELQSQRANYVPPKTDIERALVRIWSEVLRVPVGVNDNFFDSGGDSILAIRVVARAKAVGLSISARDVLVHESISDLARFVEPIAASAPAEQGPVVGDVNLTPIQRRFFEGRPVGARQLSQRMLLRVKEHLDPSLVEAAWAQVVAHHDALRHRFPAETRQIAVAPDAFVPSFARVDVSGQSSDEQRARIEATSKASEAFDLGAGPLARMVFFDRGSSAEPYLLVVAHQLIIDTVSWSILIEDLRTAYRQLESSTAVRLPPKTTSYKVWASRLMDYAKSDSLRATRSRWLADAAIEIPPLPVDETRSELVATSWGTVSSALDESRTTALLRAVPAAYGTQINDALLAAIACAFARWTGSPAVRIELEGRGRDDVFPDVALARTVGWFATMHPLVLEWDERGIGATLRRVKETVRQLEHDGLGYGVLRYLANEPGADAEVGFRFCDELEGVPHPFEVVRESSGASTGAPTRAGTLIQISGRVVAGRLTLEWTYSEAVHRRETIAALAARCTGALEELIAHCTSPGVGGYTPSDFALANLDGDGLDSLLREVGATGRGQIETIYPLTPLQAGLFFHHMMTPEDDPYVPQIGLDLDSDVDLDALERALQALVRRHAVFRTSVHAGPHGVPLQVVHRDVEIRIERHAPVPDESFEAWLEANRRRGFALAKPPLARVIAIPREHGWRLVWAAHHIIADAWSFPVVMRELAELYDDARASREVVRPPPPRFEAFVGWLGKKDPAASSQFWRKTFSGFADITSIVGRVTPGAPRWTAPMRQLSREDTLLLTTFCQRQRITLATLIYAAWGLVIGRYSDRRDVAIGIAVSGRSVPLPDIETTIGPFINTLPLRIPIPATNVSDWLGTLQAHVNEVREHEHSALVEIQHEVSSGRALFESIVSVFDIGDDYGSQLPIRGVLLHQRTHYPLSLRVNPGPELTLALEYDEARFADTAVPRALEHLERVLKRLVSSPRERASDLDILSDDERRKLLVDWNATTVDYPHEGYLHELVEKHASHTPDAVAVAGGGKSWTYGVLNRRSNQIARWLMTRGVGVGDHVVMRLPRSVEMIAAELATWKVGATFVPVDPSTPRARVEYIVEDLHAKVVFTTSTLVPLGKVAGAVCLLDAPEFLDEVGREPDSDLRLALPPSRAAYLIYTSGSTGNPKGTVVAHENLSNLVANGIRLFGLVAGDRVSQLASPAFDSSISEIWPTLAAGAALQLADEELRLSASGLVRWFRDAQIDVAFLPTPLAELAFEEDWSGTRVRVLRIGGQALRRGPPATAPFRLLNEYGPTETTVFVTAELVRGGAEVVTTIGGPVGNTAIYILDAEGRVAPIDVLGEIHVGGASVGRGYFRHPELTAEKFVPDPFGTVPGARLYRTGDRGRWLSDGRIEFAGRTDDQVKIRGYRIELGEVEAALRGVRGVREAAVIVRSDGPGGTRLVGYVALEKNAELAHALAEVRERLPDYMVPSTFVVLEALPLTVNGKVDRKALPAQDVAAAAGDYVAPRTPIEGALTRIWAEVLHLPQVGRSENFFAVGGDSILAIKVVARARQAGLRITPKQVFAHQTIADLARVAVPIEDVTVRAQGSVGGPVELTPIQRRFFARPPIDLHHFNQAILVRLERRPDAPLLRAAWSTLHEHHDTLRHRFLRDAHGWRQVCALPVGYETSFEQVDLSAQPPATHRASIEAKSAAVQASFDLTHGPLTRAVLFDLGPSEDCRLLVVAHHLVIDAVSWGILLEDLATAYQQLESKQPVRLPPKTTSFKDWAAWLTDYARSAALERERGEWDDRALRVAPLPVDRPRTNDSEGTTRTVTVSLDEPKTEALLRQAPAAYGTQINDLLLTALVQAFAQWTGSPSLLLELEGHGREDLADGIDLSRTVGWFTTTFPVVLERDPHGLAATLKRVKETLRRVKHHGIGYGVLRYMTSNADERAAWRDPEVIFNYLGQAAGAMSSAFKVAPESSGPDQSSRGHRTHLIAINGGVFDGRLQLTWSYSENVYDDATVESVARGFVDALEGIVAHCTAPGAGGYSPSDFALAKLDQIDLDSLLGELGATGRGQVEAIYPLTALQAGLFFHHMMTPGDDPYVPQVGLDVGADVDLDTLERALQALVRRHAVFRTSIHAGPHGVPLQVVHRDAEIRIERLEAPVPDESFEAWLEANRRRGFVLTKPPLTRIIAIPRERGWRLVWATHHIIEDGWSFRLVMQELAELYDDARASREIVRPPPPRFETFVAWLRKQDPAASSQFWKKTFSGFDDVGSLGGRVTTGAPRWTSSTRRLSREHTLQLNTFCQSQRITLATLIYAAWGFVIGRYSDRRDVAIGITVSGRSAPIPDIETMIGPFLNVLPLRIEIPATSVSDWLRSLQLRTNEAREHEYASLVEIQHEVSNGRALFESIVDVQQVPPTPASTQLSIGDMLGHEHTNYAMSLWAIPGAELMFALEYDEERFADTAVPRALDHLEQVLLGIVATPDRRANELPLLPHAELQKMLVEWNDTRVEYRPQCVHELVEERARNTPGATAITSAAQTWSYAELNRRANQIARWLRREGVGLEDRVVTWLPRSAENIAAQLAIWKVGAAFVPIDPTTPAARAAFTISDVKAKVVLTTSELAAAAGLAVPVVALNTSVVDDAIKRESDDDLAISLPAARAAYVIYTSGSTGQPKGAVIEQRSLSNSVANSVTLFGLTPDDRASQFASPAFDASMSEIWPTLVAGAALHLVEEHLRQAPSELIGWMRDAAITVAFLPTPLAEMAFDEDWSGSRLRVLQIGGQALHRRPPATVPFRLLNIYGPTETTDYVTVEEVACGSDAVTTIGRPVPNAAIYILDDHRRPTPIGVYGELNIGGANVSRGYFERPELTADKFVPDDFGKIPGARLYRTGDRARWLADGRIEFGGRNDDQVKVRGFRMELGEIEAALTGAPHVREAAVVVPADGPGGARLIAYLAMSPGGTVGAVEAALRKKLPEYMVPSAFIVLDALPLTVSGKLDRRALPAPDTAVAADAYVAPRSPVEEALAKIWREVLKLDRVGVEDDFFSLGGHSLLAMQVVSRVRETLGVNMSIRALFEARTIALFASTVGASVDTLESGEL